MIRLIIIPPPNGTKKERRKEINKIGFVTRMVFKSFVVDLCTAEVGTFHMIIRCQLRPSCAVITFSDRDIIGGNSTRIVTHYR